MKRTFYLLISSLIITIQILATPAKLSFKDLPQKTSEMLEQHAVYHKIDAALAARILVTFCDQIDPLHSYLLHSEVSEFLNPSKEMIQTVITCFTKGEASIFLEMFAKMNQAILRRRSFEKTLNQIPSKNSPKPLRMRDLHFAYTSEELQQRWSQIQQLQCAAAQSLKDETLYETALLRLRKQRYNFEESRIPKDKKILQQTIATYMMKAFASALDSESAYYTPTEAQQMMIGMQQRLFGIGALLRDDIDGFTVVKIVEGGPAAQQGSLQLGDKIIAINNEPIIGFSLPDVVELIRGPPGSPVILQVMREKEENKIFSPQTIRIFRGEVVVKEQRYHTSTQPFQNGMIQYLKLHSFYQDEETSAHNDLRSSLQSAKENHLKGIILDLRFNPGGLLSQAVSVTGLFLSKGIVVSLKDETGTIIHLRNLAEKPVWNGPLIILINRASASASEIVAQTLQDWGRAIVIGDDRSFGKGSFQIFTMIPSKLNTPNPQGEYKITRGRYYTVSGKSPQLTGVHSDIIIPSPLCSEDIGEKFMRFPLPEDTIAPNFIDSFSDLSFFQRPFLQKLYNDSHQTKITKWTRLLPTLKESSQQRLTHHTKTVEKSDTDLQLEEAWNIMKELIQLSTSQAKENDQEKAA